jgi:hypothetical protein|tara:strand:- start:262 stop:477 length:216 start_codon:yes stop_codon:yes gene_type:complete
MVIVENALKGVMSSRISRDGSCRFRPPPTPIATLFGWLRRNDTRGRLAPLLYERFWITLKLFGGLHLGNPD